MPRVTRAALRSNATAHEESEAAAGVPLPLTPRKRAPLGEVAGNTADPALADSDHITTKPKNKSDAKDKKRQGAKKTKNVEVLEDDKHSTASSAVKDECGELRKDAAIAHSDHVTMKPKNESGAKGNKKQGAKKTKNGEVLEDDNHSTTSSAVEDACEELRKDPHGSPLVVLHEESPIQPAPAENSASDRHSQLNTAPMDTSFHANGAEVGPKSTEEDSFVQAIANRGPSKASRAEDASDEAETLAETAKHDNSDATVLDNAEVLEDSFVNQIVTRSPAKPTLRIEDSVEAIDAFEDEIEKVGEQLPAISDAVSSAKVKEQKSIARSSAQNFRNSEVVALPKSKPQERRTSSKAHSAATGSILNSTATRVPITGGSAAARRVSSIHKAPFQPTKSTKPATVSNFELPGEAVARKLKDQREARLASGANGDEKPQQKSGPRAVKSTKPPTRSSFELPGDAVARKLKEKREERIKQQHEAEAAPAKKESKARPVRLGSAPSVRLTATSKARISLAQGEAPASRQPRTKVGNESGIKRTSIATSNASKRLSSLSLPKRAPMTATTSSARPSLASRATSRLSTAAPSQRLTSNGKPAHQTVRGKEVFERSKAAKDELEKARKEKEEAAKKARMEAAERGRIASRQWAEKQKAKKASAEKGNARGEVAATAA